MKLLDAKPGQVVRRKCWSPDCWVKFSPEEEGGDLYDETGVSTSICREDLLADDWQPVESDAEKIARLEAELVAARRSPLMCAHCDGPVIIRCVKCH